MIRNFLVWFALQHVLPLVASFTSAAYFVKSTTSAPLFMTQEVFEGKSVLLTGATGGLGKALAEEFLLCRVGRLVLSGRSAAALEKVKAELQSADNKTSTSIDTIVCDLSDPKQVDKLAQQALEKGSIDVLVNNGGVSSRGRLVDTLPKVHEEIIQINFLSGARLCHALVPQMSEGSKIIWISSVQGLLGIPNRSSYAASKFAVQGFCESIRAELASSQIGVHVISPGYINTNLSNAALQGDGSRYGQTDATTAAGADPHDVARATLKAVGQGQAETLVAAGFSAKVGIWLRLLCPGLLRSMLVKRYEKSQKIKQE